MPDATGQSNLLQMLLALMARGNQGTSAQQTSQPQPQSQSQSAPYSPNYVSALNSLLGLGSDVTGDSSTNKTISDASGLATSLLPGDVRAPAQLATNAGGDIYNMLAGGDLSDINTSGILGPIGGMAGGKTGGAIGNLVGNVANQFIKSGGSVGDTASSFTDPSNLAGMGLSLLPMLMGNLPAGAKPAITPATGIVLPELLSQAGIGSGPATIGSSLGGISDLAGSIGSALGIGGDAAPAVAGGFEGLASSLGPSLGATLGSVPVALPAMIASMIYGIFSDMTAEGKMNAQRKKQSMSYVQSTEAAEPKYQASWKAIQDTGTQRLDYLKQNNIDPISVGINPATGLTAQEHTLYGLSDQQPTWTAGSPTDWSQMKASNYYSDKNDPIYSGEHTFYFQPGSEANFAGMYNPASNEISQTNMGATLGLSNALKYSDLMTQLVKNPSQKDDINKQIAALIPAGSTTLDWLKPGSGTSSNDALSSLPSGKWGTMDEIAKQFNDALAGGNMPAVQSGGG
jgi:hypothetical protein